MADDAPVTHPDRPIPDEPTVVDGGWIMWAGRDARGEFANLGHYRTVQAYGRHPEPVLVREVVEGPYWGWIDAPGTRFGGDRPEPVMIQGHEGIFNMQFPYGPQAEAAAGKGRIVRLSVEAILGA